jgi:hypothetical protein
VGLTTLCDAYFQSEGSRIHIDFNRLEGRLLARATRLKCMLDQL